MTTVSNGHLALRLATLGAILVMLATAVLADANRDARDDRFDRIVEDLVGDTP